MTAFFVFFSAPGVRAACAIAVFPFSPFPRPQRLFSRFLPFQFLLLSCPLLSPPGRECDSGRFLFFPSTEHLALSFFFPFYFLFAKKRKASAPGSGETAFPSLRLKYHSTPPHLHWPNVVAPFLFSPPLSVRRKESGKNSVAFTPSTVSHENRHDRSSFFFFLNLKGSIKTSRALPH